MPKSKLLIPISLTILACITPLVASDWPTQPSGLLGHVKLIPMQIPKA